VVRSLLSSLAAPHVRRDHRRERRLEARVRRDRFGERVRHGRRHGGALRAAEARQPLQVRRRRLVTEQLVRPRRQSQAAAEKVAHRRRALAGGVVRRHLASAAVRWELAAPLRRERLRLVPPAGVGRGVPEGVRGAGEVDRDGGAGRGGGDHGGGGAEQHGGRREREVVVAREGGGGGGGGAGSEHGNRGGGGGRHGRRGGGQLVVVRALVGGDEDGLVLVAALHLLPDRAVGRHRATVVGARARVALGDLLPVLAPLAPVVHLRSDRWTTTTTEHHHRSSLSPRSCA
jgi:hypothetical protein